MFDIKNSAFGWIELLPEQSKQNNGGKMVYFGDIHTHNAISYAHGSIERGFDIAQEHLDFFCLTGQAQWPDIPTLPQGRHSIWVEGAAKHKKLWPEGCRMARETYQPGKFVTFTGYEWHSLNGDYTVVYPHDHGELILADTIEELSEKVRATDAMMVPHHVAYARNWRGVDWDGFPADLCPIAEVYSEHGNCMDDRGLHPMILHSLGGAVTKGTISYALARGLRFGLIASTDDHWGYPGAYREGLAAVWADELTRESIWDALQARRTYALTGDRIMLEFYLNEKPMGSEMPFDTRREIAVRVEAMDEIDKVEILKNGRVVHREHVPTVVPNDHFRGGRAKIAIRWGWGPWAQLDMERICDWQGEIRLQDAQLLKATPMFQSGPFDEDRRDRLSNVTENGLDFISFTSRQNAFLQDATKGVIVEVDGQPESRLLISLSRPSTVSFQRTFAQMMESASSHFTGEFTSESVLIHRLLVPQSYQLEFTWTDQSDHPQTTDYYMVRVTQMNGQMAWSSPIWVDGRQRA